MSNKWSIGKIIGLVLAIISLICIIISIAHEDNDIFLNIGLICMCIGLILFTFIKGKEK